MEYKVLILGDMSTNCYLVWCPPGKEAVVIDPGSQPERIQAEVKALGLSVKYIINTHGHVDHIGGNEELQAAWGAPIAIGSADASMLTDARNNLSFFVGEMVMSPAPQVLLRDGDSLHFGACSLKVLDTPGHTPGGISLYGQGLLFCGDTLFNESIGRSDLPGGDHRLLLKSIKEKLLPLPGDTLVLPGHGPASTLAREKEQNPWLQG